MAICATRNLAVPGTGTAIALVFVLVLLPGVGAAGRNAADKPHEVDGGVFAVFVNGQRVATETFRIEQSATMSTASSEVKVEGAHKAVQRAELEITPAGDLRRYVWRELSPNRSQVVVEPSEGFLVEQIVPSPPDRMAQQSFLLPVSTMVLDDYFFSHREILAWRYLAQSCAGQLQQCRPGRTQLGVLVPRQRTPLVVTIEYAGQEKVKLGGKERELSRLNLKAPDDDDWALYLDTSFKLVRIVIPAQKTEVLRQ